MGTGLYNTHYADAVTNISKNLSKIIVFIIKEYGARVIIGLPKQIIN